VAGDGEEAGAVPAQRAAAALPAARIASRFLSFMLSMASST
jgi:hypothetical protein